MEEKYGLIANRSLVIDLGTSTIKAGISTEQTPSIVIDSEVGKMCYDKFVRMSSDTGYIFPTPELSGTLKIFKPIRRGFIADEQQVKPLMEKIFSDLEINNIKTTPVFLTEPPFTPIKHKKTCASLFIDQFGAEKIFFGVSGVLSLYGLGKTEGMILESGGGLTHVTSVLRNYKIQESVSKINFGGEDITNYLAYLLKARGFSVRSRNEFAIVESIKKLFVEVQPQNNSKFPTATDQYTLPDGRKISISEERYEAGEAIFDPKLVGKNFVGVHQLVAKSVETLDIEMKKYLLENICLSGGTTQTSGFSQRLKNEISKLCPFPYSLRIDESASDRTALCWVGASAISGLSTFSEMWITKKDLEEIGENVFLQKCF